MTLSPGKPNRSERTAQYLLVAETYMRQLQTPNVSDAMRAKLQSLLEDCARIRRTYERNERTKGTNDD